MSRPRPSLAAVLALLFPGLGHLYLREWARAVVWFLLAVLAGLLVVPDAALESLQLSDPTTLLEVSGTVAADLTTVGLATVGFVVGFNVADAYSLAQQTALQHARAAGDAAAVCPHCGRELDADLDFCHWCTARLDTESDAEV